jgi:hypothetical protein
LVWISEIFLPSSTTAPPVGVISREMVFSSVDLPQAFAPTMAVMRPAGSSRSTPSTIVLWP